MPLTKMSDLNEKPSQREDVHITHPTLPNLANFILMVLYIIIPDSSNFSHIQIPFLLSAFNISSEMYNIPLPGIITYMYQILPSYSIGFLRWVLVVSRHVLYRTELSSSYRYQSPMRIQWIKRPSQNISSLNYISQLSIIHWFALFCFFK